MTTLILEKASDLDMLPHVGSVSGVRHGDPVRQDDSEPLKCGYAKHAVVGHSQELLFNSPDDAPKPHPTEDSTAITTDATPSKKCAVRIVRVV